NPTHEVFTPDGRLLVTEKGSVPTGAIDNLAFGDIRVVQNGILQPTPLLKLPVDKYFERGLDAVAIDPHFAQNGYIYVYYTVAVADPSLRNKTNNSAFNRVSRFTIDPS